MTKQDLIDIIKEEIEKVILERCQKGYKTHPTRKTKKMYGKTYRNCIKADERKLTSAEYKKKKEVANAIEEDDPDMPEAKKYAIATATAKRVAQEGKKKAKLMFFFHHNLFANIFCPKKFLLILESFFK